MHRLGCTGKRQYVSPEAAEAALSAMWSKCRPGARLPTRKYRCLHGDHWHITSSPQPPLSIREEPAA
ncbi:hypothetical protein [Amycolatopsis thermoflava]|uniref:hypothetical protein n=1 Tax=Amycolatopsis thermoflava TaxID=84480 RepID=UPI0038121AB2